MHNNTQSFQVYSLMSFRKAMLPYGSWGLEQFHNPESSLMPGGFTDTYISYLV